MLGKGENVPQEFFEFVVKEIEVFKQVHASGERLFIVDNKRDFPRYNWLIDARVELDSTAIGGGVEEFIVKQIEFNLNPLATRKGEEIGLLVVPA